MPPWAAGPRPEPGDNEDMNPEDTAPLLPDLTSDERAEGWGDWREDEGNDARLREDVPPHW
ncbi:hypothetical protein EDD29_1386 [Actinocorallia herbida]|uniref:Uncharacterized protein n=1 Tax=Actinocorallia herbida TaxID=58109 RepID=A0A3N1CRD5_9ACTN|nr:hypothetical protein EDD29_1386 [Actinocorallia herbida]